MPVVQVGIVRMPMHQRRVAMAVRMSLVRRLAGRMLVLMMFIVNMAVLMLDRLMHVLIDRFPALQAVLIPSSIPCTGR